MPCVLDSTRMHLVRFPQQDITAYAFYEAVEVPEEELVRTVNQPAAVIIQEQEAEGGQTQEEAVELNPVRLVASVPDIVELEGRDIRHSGYRHLAGSQAQLCR